jgi:hypothetical protein
LVLIEVLLPLYDNEGQPLDRALFAQVGTELTERYGGLTAHTRAPATGLWKPSPADHPTHDDIVIYEVMADALDRDWWTAYRRRLETRFRQEQVIIRAVQLELL